ncbi:energy transducer TonB [Tenacibaculum aestuariivivum]|uniref:energy transducer TonB n=1 Tax=Tenacibaculum aestuariivivum TaxID=2006131 RepID=UPI003AB306A5
MKKFKKLPSKQLEKFSSIFTQLGLVLTLFIVFVSLEYETEKKTAEITIPYHNFEETAFRFSRDIVIKKNKPVVKKRKVKTIIPPQVVKNNEVVIQTVVKNFNKSKSIINTVPVKKNKPVTEKVLDNVISIKNVQKVPIFKGCEELSEEENKLCFERKINKHIQRYFNSDIAQDVGLSSGKYNIITQFIIDKQGAVTDIKIRAPHKKLEKETNYVIGKIPNFIPGKQNDKPVKVKYTLPITFKVE